MHVVILAYNILEIVYNKTKRSHYNMHMNENMCLHQFLANYNSLTSPISTLSCLRSIGTHTSIWSLSRWESLMKRVFLKRAKDIHMWHRSNYDWVLFLTPTSPLLRFEPITSCLLSKRSGPLTMPAPFLPNYNYMMQIKHVLLSYTI